MTEHKRRSVFVVGAGASHEFGLPVGKSLQEHIAELTRMRIKGASIQPLSHNKKFYDSLPKTVGLSKYTILDLDRLSKKAHEISESVVYAASIDNYLHANRSDEEMVAIGKIRHLSLHPKSRTGKHS